MQSPPPDGPGHLTLADVLDAPDELTCRQILALLGSHEEAIAC